jgi:hypothetical protein
MGVLDIFSNRQKRLRGEVPDVYSYDTLPEALRVQIVHIWCDTLGSGAAYRDDDGETRNAYRKIVKALCREYGVFALPTSLPDADHFSQLTGFLLQERNADKALDAVELSFRVIDNATRKWGYRHHAYASEEADAAIEELNARFREHGVGYQFVDGEIVRVDSELLHVEVVKPALALLRATEYAGAQQEFLKAHEHYRHGRMKEALAECLKALESVLKVVCATRGWAHDPNATCNALVQILFDKGLIPSFWNQHFSALRSTLESGVPTARNRLGAHGQGGGVVEVPGHLVAYVLHLTASAILFIADANRTMP